MSKNKYVPLPVGAVTSSTDGILKRSFLTE